MIASTVFLNGLIKHVLQVLLLTIYVHTKY